MWRRAVQAGIERVARYARLAVVFAAVLLGLGLMASAAEACSDSKQAIVQAAAARQVEGLSQSAIVFVSMATIQTTAKLRQSGTCCGAGCHAHGSACGNACGAGGLAAINDLNLSLLSLANSAYLSPIDEAEAISAQPPQDLRPPRTLI